MIKKLLPLVLFSIVALVFTGCDGGSAQMGPNSLYQEANLLGLAKIEASNYGPTGSDTLAVSTDELYTRKNVSGDKVTLLWGLITLKDY